MSPLRLGRSVGLAVLLVLAFAATPALAAHPRAKVNVLTVEANVMCPSCHEPLEVAQSPQAQAEKAYVKQLVNQGLTLKQIENELVAQYGPSVLGRPPARGVNLLVYILPPVLLAAGIVFLLVTLPKWRARSRAAARTPLESGRALTPDESERLDLELARFS